MIGSFEARAIMEETTPEQEAEFVAEEGQYMESSYMHASGVIVHSSAAAVTTAELTYACTHQVAAC